MAPEHVKHKRSHTSSWQLWGARLHEGEINLWTALSWAGMGGMGGAVQCTQQVLEALSLKTLLGDGCSSVILDRVGRGALKVSSQAGSKSNRNS